MFDTMNFNGLKTGFGTRRTRESAAFALDIRPGQPLRDRISGVEAISNIPGDRWGIVNGVLTRIPAYEAAVVDDGLRACPEFTQSTLYSEDLTNAVWTAARCSMALYDTFQGCNVHKLTENTDSNIQHYLRQVCFTSISDESVVGLCFIVKRQGRDAVTVQATTKAGSYIPGIKINLINGSITSAGGFTKYSVASMGSEFYRVFIAYNVGTGASTPFFFIAPVDGAGVSVYTGDGVSGILLGQISHVDFGVSGTPFIPPYIPNQTSGRISVVSESATATTGTSFDLDNARLVMLRDILRGPNAQGRIEFEIMSNINTSDIPYGSAVNSNILSVSNNSFGLIYYYKPANTTNGSFKSYDGVNSTQINKNITKGELLKIILDFGTYTDGTQKQRLTVNGAASISDFRGSFGDKGLCFFFGLLVLLGWIKKDSFKIYIKPRW